MLEQRLDEIPAAVNLELRSLLLLERMERLRHIALQERRVLPVELLEGA